MTREEAIEAWNRGTVMREILFREKRLDNGLRAHSTHIVIFVVRH